MPLIFISYDSADSETATQLASALRSAGFATWLYEENSLPGPSYLDQIVKAIQESDVVAIVISQESMQSLHVRKELFKAYESGKELLPILRGVTHAEFRVVRPDLHQALMTNVAIPVPEAGLDSIIDRIVAGIRAMIQKEFLSTAAKREERPQHSGAGHAVAAADPWKQLEARLSGFTGEVRQMRGRLEQAWTDMSRRYSDSREWRSLALERVKMADEVVREVLDYVIERESFTPEGFALIARGGFGRGFLSEGSDVDITLLFAEDIPDEAQPFWARFEQMLTDVWGAVTCIRVSPLATSVTACVHEWQRVFSDVDPPRLASYVSFAYSRFIAGSSALHDRLRREWCNVARAPRGKEMNLMLRQLKDRLQLTVVDASVRSFNLKSDAGGLLEFRLTGYIEQLLSCRSVQFVPDGVELVNAHEFFLILRDQLYRKTQTPSLSDSDLEPLVSEISRTTGVSMTSKELWDKVIRNRRRVRAAFKSAVEALAKTAKKRANSHEAN